MFGKKTERIIVLILSIAVLLSSTGVLPSLAADASELSSSSVSESTSAEISQEGGSVTTTQISQEGGSLNTLSGEGTSDNPYKIADANDFLAMQNIINDTSKSDKYFELTSDVDLSSVKADDFNSNGVYGGSLISVDKALAKASKNVGFKLDGNGHKIIGLNVSSDDKNGIAVFGYINSTSSVSNIVFETPAVTSSADTASIIAVVSAENDGTISNVTVNYPVLTAVSAKYAGVIAAVNRGTVINCTVKGKIANSGTATKDSHTVSASGVCGAVVGYNSGKITSVSAINVGIYIPEGGNSVCGVVAGRSNGTITNSIATGAISGGDSKSVAGGVVGEAVTPDKNDNKLSITNVYVLTAISKSVVGNAVIGANGTSDMLKDCYWSSIVSGRNTTVDFAGTGINDLSFTSYKTVCVGKSVELKSNDLGFKWGKASFSDTYGYRASGKSVELINNKNSATVKGTVQDSVSSVVYNVDIMLPSEVGAGDGSVKLVQALKTAVLVLPKGVSGDGTEKNPVEISTAGELALIAKVPYMNYKLVSDITLTSVSPFEFCGTIDGNGHTLTVDGPLFSTVYGYEEQTANVRNIKIVVSEEINSAVLGTAANAKLSGVQLVLAQNVVARLSSKTGVLLNSVNGASVIDDCHVSADIMVMGDKAKEIGAFAGSVDGNGAIITNSGVNTVIKSDKNSVFDSVSGFIGSVNADNTTISNCYVTGSVEAGKFAFIGKTTTNIIKVENIIWNKGGENSAQSPVDFTNKTAFDEKQFSIWHFNLTGGAFFTGKGGKFIADLPQIKALQTADKDDFTVNFDSEVINASVNIDSGKLVLNVSRADGAVTVANSPITITENKTGLSVSLSVSNGLDKDSDGNYIIASSYDLAYLSENINEYSDSNFIMSADVDMSEIGDFKPIGGTDASFSGVFDGNGHTILNLNVNGTSKSALFATLDSAVVKNLTFKNAKINAKGSYSAVLAGQAVGNTVIKSVSILNSQITADDLYSAALVGSVNSESEAVISDITVSDTVLLSSAGFVGGVAGRADGNVAFANLTLINLNVSGAQNIGGAIGAADGKVKLSSVSVSNSDISGISDVAGLVGTSGSETVISNVKLISSSVSTVGNDSSYVSGGISASSAADISNASVDNSTVKGGIAGGIVGRSTGDININNVKVSDTAVSAEGTGTVAAGILAVHNSGGTASVSNAKLSSDSSVSGAAVSAGIVGDCSGETSFLNVKASVSLADIKGDMTASAVSAAGIVGKIGVKAINNVKLNNVKAMGNISSAASVGGIIGCIKNTDNGFDSKLPLINGCVSSVTVSSNGLDSCGLIIGAVENNVLNSENIASAVQNAVISTAMCELGAYSAISGISGDVYDVNNPGGKPVSPSENVLKNTDEIEITISNLPQINGFVFDSNSGWVSESEERIAVIDSTENTVRLKALRKSEVMIVTYYISEDDAEFSIPVGFKVKADLRDKLEGSGTEAEPYLISNAYELETMAQYAGDNAYFVLTDDIVLNDSDFAFGGGFYNVGNGIVTIGNAEQKFTGHFSGLYNGKIHTISGLRTGNNTFGGLFGAIESAVISDLIIDYAQTEGEYYSGILVGCADNSTITGVTVKNSKVNSVQGGSFAGVIVGLGNDVNIENVTVENCSVTAAVNSDSSTFEAVGGIAGQLCGSINKAVVNNVKIETSCAAGGLVGVIPNGDNSLVISDAESVADVRADYAGGVIGKLSNPALLKISDVSVGGCIEGFESGAGIAASVTAESVDFDVSMLKTPMIKHTVIAADISGNNNGIVIGETSADIFTDAVNKNTDVFTNVYYSSYQNSAGVFGTNEINSYQSYEYIVNDLNDVKYSENGEKYNSVKLGADYKTLNDDSFTVGDFDSWKQLVIGDVTLNLTDITCNQPDTVVYDSDNSAVRLIRKADNAVLELVYDNGLKVSIPIEADFKLAGNGTKDSPYLISSAEDFAVMQQSAVGGNAYYALTSDINLNDVQPSESFDANLDGNGFVLYGYTGKPLFGSVTGSIVNVGFAGFAISDSESKSVGAVAEILNGAVIKNCFVIADVSANLNNQDAGILAGRAVNGTYIDGCLTSGRVVSNKAISVGGIVGYALNSEVLRSASTAYVYGGKFVGGIVGEADNSSLDTVVFANMTESVSGTAANIAGNAVGTKITDAYFDSSASVSDKFVGSGSADTSYALSTEQLVSAKISGFISNGGYPVPSGLISESNSSAFDTGVAFAALPVRYLYGLNSGTASNYTDIKVEPEVNGNKVNLVIGGGYKLTLEPVSDYTDSTNEIARYSNPSDINSLSLSYKLSGKDDGELKNSVISVMLRSGKGLGSTSFGLFTKLNAQSKQISDIAVADGVLYVSVGGAAEDRDYTVSAIDGNGVQLQVTEINGEYAVSVGSSETVSLSIEIGGKADQPWGLRSIWRSITNK
ncbi:MAG: hypothetical protein PUB20_00165 [Clostridia bacterium]|nr:hypothetical protein [Clostridia bacterium]